MRLPLYLGIDQSYSGCAVVTYSPGNNPAVHTFDFSPARAGTGARRLARIRHDLGEHFTLLLGTGDVRRICHEGYAYGARFRREELGELGGILRLALHDAFPSQPTYAVAPATVKKFATGSGRADKDKMLLAVYKRWSFEAASHDIADAYTLARIAAALDHPDPPEQKFQREVIDTIVHPKATATGKAA